MTDDGRTKAVYKSNDACCSNVVAISSRMVAFDDDYNVKTVDVDDGRVDRIAGFSNFVVSPDGRWLAGWAESGGHGPETIGVVSADGATCLAVPKPQNADDFDPSFSADGKRLFFTRRRFDPHTRTPEHRLSVLLSALPRSRQAC